MHEVLLMIVYLAAFRSFSQSWQNLVGLIGKPIAIWKQTCTYLLCCPIHKVDYIQWHFNYLQYWPISCHHLLFGQSLRARCAMIQESFKRNNTANGFHNSSEHLPCNLNRVFHATNYLIVNIGTCVGLIVLTISR